MAPKFNAVETEKDVEFQFWGMRLVEVQMQPACSSKSKEVLAPMTKTACHK